MHMTRLQHALLCIFDLQEELRILRQQQADYSAHMQYSSHHETLHASLSSGAHIRNADGNLQVTHL